ncbi:MAG: hypothetical protein V4569_10830 [Pseudomonadota bacterium]
MSMAAMDEGVAASVAAFVARTAAAVLRRHLLILRMRIIADTMHRAAITGRLSRETQQ